MPYKDPADWKRWRDQNIDRQREKERVYQAAYRETHREADRAKGRRYYEAHKDELLARKRAWKQSEAGQTWFEGYRQTHNENVRRSYYRDLEASRLKRVATQARRRARQASAGGTASYEEIMARVAFYGERCYLCGGTWEHIDHVIPLARGGSNWPANLRPICASCNGKKHSKPLKEVRRHLAVISA